MRIRFAVAALALIAGFGCGGDRRCGVQGSVKLDGVPVENGSICFYPVEKTDSPNVSAAIEGGTYVIPVERGPRPGVFRVEFNVLKKTGRQIPSSDPGVTVGEVVEILPAKYNSKSTMTAKIKPRDNTLDFELTSK